MNKVLIALAAGFVTLGAYAADDINKARADVKMEARDANVKGEIGDGDANSLAFTAQAKLNKEEMAAVRSMVKAEAAAANKQGTIKTGNK